MNSHLLFHPPQMADDTAADAKTGDGSQKKKKKKRNEADSDETAPKHLKKKKKKEVRRDAAETGLQPSRRIPSHPAALFAPPAQKRVLFNSVHTLPRVLVAQVVETATKHNETASDDIPDDRFRPVSRTHPAAFPPHCPPPPPHCSHRKNAYFLTVAHFATRLVVAHSCSRRVTCSNLRRLVCHEDLADKRNAPSERCECGV